MPTDIEVLNEQEQPSQPTAVPEDWKSLLSTLLNQCENEDSNVHNALIRKVRRLQLYFDNILNLFWDDVTGDYVIPDWDKLEDEGVPPRIINMYRPHGESIIAALSVSVPNTLFFPEDPDNADDIDTAESYTNLAKIVQKHNKAQLLFIKLLTILFNQGTVFAYTYFRRDKKFGYYTTYSQEVVDINTYTAFCPECGNVLGDGLDEELMGPVPCQNCGNTVEPLNEPQVNQEVIQVPEQKEKGRGHIDLFGPLNVKVPYSARTQEHCGYLLLKFDQSVAYLRSIFCAPGAQGEKPLLENIQANSADTTYDSWIRFPSIYMGAQPENTAVVKVAWYRNWQFDLLGDKDNEVIQNIKAKFPNGCCVIYINDIPAEIFEDNLDEHWTISQDPRSSGLHGEPMGTNLAMIQDINAELNELELQIVEHGISELFVASDAIDFEKYNEVQARPGQRVPAFKEAGKNLSDNFYETRTSTLSPELQGLTSKYNNLAEFVTGNFPTVYGGPVGGASTATEYTKSQSQALQRLGTVWKIASFLWADVINKAVREYASYLDYEEKLVERTNNGFNATTVNPQSLMGNIGSVEPEFSEQLPISWQQIRELFIQLLQFKDPQVMSMLAHPENFEMIRKAIGLTELYVPGSNDRTKQYREIDLLMQAAPTMTEQVDPMTGIPVPQMQPSIMPEPFDNHALEAEICQVWLTSSKGQKAKVDNPQGYQNVVAHWQAHMSMMPPPMPEENQSEEGNEEGN